MSIILCYKISIIYISFMTVFTPPFITITVILFRIRAQNKRWIVYKLLGIKAICVRITSFLVSGCNCRQHYPISYQVKGIAFESILYVEFGGVAETSIVVRVVNFGDALARSIRI